MNPSTPNPLLEAALDYARRGWRVIPLHNLVDGARCSCDAWRAEKGIAPCDTPGKHPRFSGWIEKASTQEGRIRAWWKNWPEANVGIVSGKASNTIILDTDPRNGGDWSRGRLIEQHGQLGDCPTCVTGGGGLHEHFAWPEGLDTTQGMVELDDGLEVLLHGHNVVMPPSFAHVGREPYFWDVEPGESLPPAPAWLVDLVKIKLQPDAAAGAKPDAGGSKWPPADIGAIFRGCEWLQWTSENAAALSEPQWYAQLSIVGRCENGEQLAHDLSSAYPGYNRSETQKKLQHAIRDAGPATCAKIRHSLGGERFCARCPAKVKSPIVLGIAGRQQPQSPEPPASTAAAEPGANVVSGETFTLEQLVARAIAAGDVALAFDLAPLLAAEKRHHARQDPGEARRGVWPEAEKPRSQARDR
jgi:hypothetical protein